MSDMIIGWFDAVLVAVIVSGILRGRKRGMSEELLPLLMWLAVLIGCALAYEPVAGLFGNMFSELWRYRMAYVSVLAVIVCVCLVGKRVLGGKLLGSDLFGKSEYYMGMAAGMVRFLCVLLALLALLNSRLYTKAEVKANLEYVNDVYGSDFFPGAYTLQNNVFEHSFSGKFIKENLSFLLIKPTVLRVEKFKQREWEAK